MSNFDSRFNDEAANKCEVVTNEYDCNNNNACAWCESHQMFSMCRLIKDAQHQPTVLFSCAKTNGTQPQVAEEEPVAESEELKEPTHRNLEEESPEASEETTEDQPVIDVAEDTESPQEEGE
jgi:hypothetical protein